MNDIVTKEDLRQFGLLIMNSFREAIKEITPKDKIGADNEWLKSKIVRKLLDISPGSLQNLRITGKIRFKKVLGSYYYSRHDIDKLFSENLHGHGSA